MNKYFYISILFLFSINAIASDYSQMTIQTLSYIPALDNKSCEFRTYSQHDDFKFSKKGKVREAAGGCVISFTSSEFYKTFKFCSLQPNNERNIFTSQLCQTWVEGDKVHFYTPAKNKSMCLYMCVIN